eukprot:CAMPEP_0172867334 /NCGR_PEP_ID=MMETSP1075-20121228/83354_1 /TAXON_ID=2916 /ORGANISM="Ceratium fusus, Strain PA161109" /LENGTH=59 /DNA_ID=CAMNT_0013716677 /DNA_START=46 /DNA_END=222 /DNA_ORIENTATION=-
MMRNLVAVATLVAAISEVCGAPSTTSTNQSVQVGSIQVVARKLTQVGATNMTGATTTAC